jgi:hypothetical protein
MVAPMDRSGVLKGYLQSNEVLTAHNFGICGQATARLVIRMKFIKKKIFTDEGSPAL